MKQETPKYDVLAKNDLYDMKRETERLLADGWQFAGPLIHTKEYGFVRDFLKFPQPPQQLDMSQRLTDSFNTKLTNMDAEVKELLDINNIRLICQDGKFFTSYEGEISDGISPNQVLEMLKSSKHCPLDLDEKKVISAIEGLL